MNERQYPRTNLIDNGKWNTTVNIHESSKLATMIQYTEQAKGSANKNIKISITIEVNNSRGRIYIGTERSSVNTDIKICSPFNLFCIEIENNYATGYIFFYIYATQICRMLWFVIIPVNLLLCHISAGTIRMKQYHPKTWMHWEQNKHRLIECYTRW